MKRTPKTIRRKMKSIQNRIEKLSKEIETVFPGVIDQSGNNGDSACEAYVGLGQAFVYIGNFKVMSDEAINEIIKRWGNDS